MSVTPLRASSTGHLGTCRWFWAWAAVGFGLVLGFAGNFSIGPFVLPFVTLLLGIACARRPGVWVVATGIAAAVAGVAAGLSVSQWAFVATPLVTLVIGISPAVPRTVAGVLRAGVIAAVVGGAGRRTRGRDRPATGFREASGLDPAVDRRAWDQIAPSDGSLPEAQLRALGEALAPFSSTPEHCFFCLWEGFGFWGGRVSYSLGGGADEREAARLEAVARADRESAQIDGLPRVHLTHRDHHLFTGPLASTDSSFHFGVWQQSPNLWWPADRAWFVATEIDGYSTYAGGRAACIDAVLGCPALEALPVRADTRLDPGPHR